MDGWDYRSCCKELNYLTYSTEQYIAVQRKNGNEIGTVEKYGTHTNQKAQMKEY